MILRLLEAEKFLKEAEIILKCESRTSLYGHLAETVRQEKEHCSICTPLELSSRIKVGTHLAETVRQEKEHCHIHTQLELSSKKVMVRTLLRLSGRKVWKRT